MSDEFEQFLERNRQPVQQGPVNIRDSIAKVREKKSQRGVLPYMTNAVNAVNRGVTQVVETPYNIVNRAPQLVNLLPGEQGVGSIDEMAKGTWAEGAFPSKDPIIDFMERNHPGLNEPNPNYPRTNQFGEDVGIGVGSMGMSVPLSMLKGVGGPIVRNMGKYADDLVKLFRRSPKAAVAGEVAASAGAAGGREVADQYDMGPVGSFTAEMIGALGTGALAYSGPEAISKVFSREGGGETLEAMERLNMRPSVGVTGNEMAGQMENAAGIVPILGSSARKVQRQQFDEFGDILRGTASDVRPNELVSRVEPIMIGEQVKDISEEGLQKIKRGFGQREDALMEAIGPRTPVGISQTRTAIEEMIPKVDPELQGALSRELEILDQMVDEAGNVPYEQLRSFRTNVGRRTNQPSLAGGQSKQIYKAITGDTQAVADAAGAGDDFTKLMSEQAAANTKKTGDIPRLKSLVENDPESSFKMFEASVKNPDKMRLLKESATPEQWDELSSNTIEYLGLATDAAQGAAGDVISANTFLTRWNKMDPRTRNILFDDELGTLDKLNDMAIVAEGMKHRGHGANFSNTAGVGMGANLITGGLGGAGLAANAPVTIGATGLTYGAIKGLMSETLARWAAGRTPGIQSTIGARVPSSIGRASTESEQYDR